MSIKSEYEKRIEAYIESNSPECDMKRVQRIEIEGRIKDLPVYRLPIKLLIYNVENGRFAADLRTKESTLGRKLNTRNVEDANTVKQILLSKSSHDTQMFREDLKKRGQIDPGVITAAGVVINGNRRMAILTELHAEFSQDKYNYLETSILPRNISDSEIFKIEARLQYAKDYKQEFGAVNELLKMEEGMKHMSKRELATLLVRDEKYIDEHLAQLSLLKSYSKYAWKRIDYKKIEEEQLTEKITGVENIVRKLKGEERRPSEIAKLLEVQFAYIKSGCSYRDIRDFDNSVFLDGTEQPYFEALSQMKNGKVSEESFKEMVDDVNEGARIIKKDRKQIELVIRILEQVKIFRDKEFKVTPEIKKYLVEISNIIAKLLKH